MLILRWLINAGTLFLLPHLLSGISFASFYAALLVALVLGLINALIRPLLILITLPINLLTLGLFTFVINGLLFWFVASVVKGFSVDGFWTAVLGALLYSVISSVASALLLSGGRKD